MKLLILSLLASLSVIAQARICTPQKELCFTAKMNGQNVDFEVEAGPTATGWLGLGFGSTSMAGADIIVMYMDGDKAVVKNAAAVGNALSPTDPKQYIAKATRADNKFRFTRPLTASPDIPSMKTLKDGDKMIYAVGAMSGSTLQKHSQDGQLTFQFDKQDTAASKATPGAETAGQPKPKEEMKKTAVEPPADPAASAEQKTPDAAAASQGKNEAKDAAGIPQDKAMDEDPNATPAPSKDQGTETKKKIRKCKNCCKNPPPGKKCKCVPKRKAKK